ncbi:MAG: hypothetical protein KDD02_25355 [Phaeodactylibacter sp.]|nr:hypothetical protein [Phaeodactylibacter sp.]
MGKRHEAIGIKQLVRLEWMQKTANLLLAGLDAPSIRQELHDFLSDRKGDGSQEERGEASRTQVVNMLMKIWITPHVELVPFRDAALALLGEQPSAALPIHWAMISAAYPFWFNVAHQAGRLLNLQGQVTQQQITTRIKERYGDRQTVTRYARYVIRSFVAWNVLEDTAVKGCYRKAAPSSILDAKVVSLLFESALHARPEGKVPLALLFNTPAFFPFQLPPVPGGFVTQHAGRIEVIRYGMDEELLSLRGS